MKIKSITDVITNSSSEVFLIKKIEPTRDYFQEIRNFHESHKMTPELHEEKYGPIRGKIDLEKIRQDKFDYFSSGSGGPIDVLGETENALELEIDENFLATIDYITENYEILERYPT